MPARSPLPRIRELARQFAAERNVDDHVLIDRFIADVESAWDALVTRIGQRRDQQGIVSKIARGRAVAAACEVLRMDPPQRGKTINLRKAKTQKRLLIRSFHPDSGSGDRERLAEVLAAYDTLEHYSKMEDRT